MQRVALTGLRRRRQRLPPNRGALLACIATARATDFVLPEFGAGCPGFRVLFIACPYSIYMGERSVRLSEQEGGCQGYLTHRMIGDISGFGAVQQEGENQCQSGTSLKS